MGEDEDVFFPTVRATWELLPGRGARDESQDEERGVVEGTFSLDFEASYAEAEFTQSLGSREVIVLDGVEFVGADQVKGDVELSMASLSARGGMSLFDQLKLEGIAGLGVAYMELELESE